MRKSGKNDSCIEPRHKAHIPAFISNLSETFQMRCIIRDISEHGCQFGPAASTKFQMNFTSHRSGSMSH